MTMTYHVFSIVYFDKAGISLCVVNNKADLSTAEMVYAAEIIKGIIVHMRKRRVNWIIQTSGFVCKRKVEIHILYLNSD